ncbi:hypothetical protein KIP48_gp36 [Mycobacterium phage Naca]|uniref:Uncharacterized protein n=1 Tax=Mycobacterium phage Naca TaxID=2126816 RepID=A0A2P1N2G0_9CAUD|nr:hypothetical protein KIP48_gp36 [Mycobacterium phage Naca]AVP42094.1 hypothetical protein SEA_NACA_57 [Mycobacterium phage Naca]
MGQVTPEQVVEWSLVALVAAPAAMLLVLLAALIVSALTDWWGE